MGADLVGSISTGAANRHPRARLQVEREKCVGGGGFLVVPGGTLPPCPGQPCPQSLAAKPPLSLGASRCCLTLGVGTGELREHLTGTYQSVCGKEVVGL